MVVRLISRTPLLGSAKILKYASRWNNYSTKVEYKPIRSVLVANRGEIAVS